MIEKLTNVKLIMNRLKASTKKEVLDELAQALFDDGCIITKDDFLEDINIRESISVTSTDGIAYPHTKSKSVIKPAIAVGIKREGLDYGDEDGIEPTVFFMIASPDNGADHHIYVLQDLFGKFSEEFIEAMHNANSEHQILDVLVNP